VRQDVGVTESEQSQAKWSTARGVLVGGLVVYIVLAGVFLVLGTRGDVEWGVVRDVLLITATIGTAIGTVGLAAYTFQLASVTRESVAGAKSQLDEVKAQGVSLAKQAEAMLAQTDSSAASAKSAERARIDAIAPLVSLRVYYSSGFIGVGGDKPMTMHKNETWPLHQLPVIRIETHLTFEFKNVGNSPASLEFGGLASQLKNVADKRLSPCLLMPGQVFKDEFVQRFDGRESVDGLLLKFAITYNGLLHGEMFDHIEWKGWVTPLKLDGETLRVNNGYIVNASSAQVVRSYFNLERPEEMANLRENLLSD
jgi:hypothetical protein